MAISDADKQYLVSLYVGYFNRAPDPAGLQYWINVFAAGGSALEIAQAFATSAESQALYPFMATPDVSTPESFITSIYVNLFGRAPEAAGLEFWAAALSEGRATPGEMIKAIVEGAQGTDADIVANKAAVAIAFTETLADMPGMTWDADAATASSDILSDVTADEASVDEAVAAIADYASGSVTGEIFQLENNVLDNIQGTAANDRIIANLTDTDGNANEGDLEFDDIVNGADGTDTMVLYTWGDANIDTADYDITSVERVILQARNGQDANVNIDLGGVGGLETVEVVNFVGGESDVIINNAPGVVLIDNFQNEDNDIEINFADTVTTAEITLDDVVADDVDVTGDTVTDLTVNLNGVDDNNSNSDFQFDADDEAALASVTVNVTAESNMFFDFNESTLENLASVTINADADFTGGIDLAEDANGNDVTTTLTINGAGDVNINGIWEDDVVNVVYTGSGSLALGRDEALDSVSGSFNASTATGDVTVYLDLDENGVESFDFVGSSGVNTVYIADSRSAADAVLDDNGNVDANVSISIAAGAGTEDVLVVTDANDVGEFVADIYSGFETLRVEQFGNDANYDLTFLGADFERVELVYDDNNNLNNNVEVQVTADLADSIFLIEGAGEDFNTEDLTITLDDADGLDDTMTVTIENTEDSNDINFDIADELIIDGVEFVTFNSTGTAEDANGNEQSNVVGEFFADELRVLTITGDVNFEIDDNLVAEELFRIDATGFTGDSLRLEDVEVGGGMEYLGSATADQNIDISAIGDDVTVTTGSGDDNIFVSIFNPANSDDVVINAGDGDNTIIVDSNDNFNANTSFMDVAITTGDGNDNILVADVRDVTINSGNGDSFIRIAAASGDVSVTTGEDDDVVILGNDGNANINIDTNANWDSASIDVGAGDDLVIIDMDVNVNANTVEVALGAGEDALFLVDIFEDVADLNDNDLQSTLVVEVADFDVTEDVILLGDGNPNAFTLVFDDAIIPDGEYDVSGSYVAGDGEQIVLELAFEADHNGLDFAELYADGNLDGNALLEAIGFDLGNAVITVDEGSDGYLVAYNGGDAYLFAFENAADANVNTTTDALSGSEIALVGVFENVAVGSFTADNFDPFAII